MTKDSTRGVARSLAALALALGLVFLLLNRLGYEVSNRALEPADGAGAVTEPVRRTIIPDPRVAVLMDQITASTLLAYERALTGAEAVLVGGEPYTIPTRHSYSGAPISRATRYVHAHFQSLGLDVHFQPYAYGGYDLRNVVAERRGSRRPEEIYLITAHLDNMPWGPIAPGADDNASGSAAVLVASDLLNHIDFDCTLRFVLFTGEEQFLRGSGAYAAAITAEGDDARGVLNLDMIGYNSDADPIVDLHAQSAVPGSTEIAETFSQVVATYGLDLTPEIVLDHYLGNYSDNKSFWDQGFPAILAIEDHNDETPYYHTTNDTIDTLDWDYFVEFVRAGVGTFAHMGCLSTGLLTGTVTALDTGVSLPALVTAGAQNGVYTTTVNAQGYYTLTLPAYTFTAQASLPHFSPAVIEDVVILAGQTAVGHFVLEPWPFGIFSPTVLK